MKDYAVMVRAPGKGVAQNVEAVSAEGHGLEGEAAQVAREALLRAADLAGGTPMLTDGDTYLDQEGPGGNLDLALGIIVGALAGRGFPVRVVSIDRCEACDGSTNECRVCRGRGFVEHEAPPDPKGDA